MSLADMIRCFKIILTPVWKGDLVSSQFKWSGGRGVKDWAKGVTHYWRRRHRQGTFLGNPSPSLLHGCMRLGGVVPQLLAWANL